MAATIAGGIVEMGAITPTVVLGGLIGAIAWNLATWWFGLPSSSSQALIGGLAGAGLAAAATIDVDVLVSKVLLPLVLSPVAGFALAYFFMAGLHLAFRSAAYGRTLRPFRLAQTLSASAMALGHGLQDGQKTMGVMVLALVAAGRLDGDGVPAWVRVSAAFALGLGTLAGGWRIMRTLGRRVVHVDPVTGFAAETVASSLLYVSAYVFTAPISSTHAITASIAGAGTANGGLGAVRWRVLRPIVAAWAVTLPVTTALGALGYAVLTPLL